MTIVNFLETIVRVLEKIPGFRDAAAQWDIRIAGALRGHMAVPQYPERLPGEFWGIGVLFGQYDKEIRRRNFSAFRARSKQQGLKLLAVEQVLPGQDFLLSPRDADRVIQIRGGDILWQKERLLNYGLDQLPQSCDKVVCLDADTLFLNENWVLETACLLEKYKVVQPFKNVLWLDPGRSDALVSAPLSQILPKKHDDLYRGAAYQMSLKRFGLWDRDTTRVYGDPGYPVAFRRKLLAEVGFYEKLVIGGGDRVMMQSLYHSFDEGLYRKVELYRDLYPSEHYKDLPAWSRRVFEQFRKSVFFTGGTLAHLWHGERIKRQYFPRLQILKDYGYDSCEDIKLDASGCWAWATEKKEMHRAVAEYFKSRV